MNSDKEAPQGAFLFLRVLESVVSYGKILPFFITIGVKPWSALYQSSNLTLLQKM